MGVDLVASEVFSQEFVCSSYLLKLLTRRDPVFCVTSFKTHSQMFRIILTVLETERMIVLRLTIQHIFKRYWKMELLCTSTRPPLRTRMKMETPSSFITPLFTTLEEEIKMK